MIFHYLLYYFVDMDVNAFSFYFITFFIFIVFIYFAFLLSTDTFIIIKLFI